MPTPPDDLVATLRAAGCVFAEDEAALLVDAAPPGPERDALVARRVAGEPLEHVLGCVEFDGATVLLGPGVFVPRQRSVLLVELAAALAPRIVVDLCCGSGALGLAIARRCPGAVVHAADVDDEAARWAQLNLAPVGGHAYAGDLDAPLPSTLRGRVDVLVANVPYVPSDAVADLPPEAREHEPLRALDGGDDGLDVLRLVAARAPRWLRPGGALLSEVGDDQVEPALALLDDAGLAPAVHRDDERGALAVSGTSTAGGTAGGTERVRRT